MDFCLFAIDLDLNEIKWSPVKKNPHKSVPCAENSQVNIWEAQANLFSMSIICTFGYFDDLLLTKMFCDEQVD